ncbi:MULTISPECIES: protein-disulfide reductase DsbD [Enterobacter]|uniref:protein-disulfide reductase DsbD family protein n=1 Tax=Enterobacter TaxID=547 RepID=UPI000FEB7DBC|nr:MULTISPECIES: protein-disulfide reductase DsbD domain-containing protein [Enterobacter]MCR1302066.1 protein-disulfide reductase DsbD family protein [Enterobacter sp. FL1277]MCR1307173.1 protein-disulfide reductase DsbD family protein [Enterobacter sp. BT1271]MCR1312841.1 protein-disulfide reductase DsbD family protein [Enterobacter sp. BT855]MCR1323421.1 protein-disulfide reductase DsbD family protein [Enterobacter sp. BT1268]MCR1329358.1 protein-disulfide reductase DsbD family protein [Ent
MFNLFRGFVFLWLSCIGITHAADTGWQVSPQNDHARIRFQAERDQNRIQGLLTVELKPGWKTYWRAPGEGGVAPKISWPEGVTDSWSWPVPSRFDISGMTTQGYHDKVTIPIVLDGVKGDAVDGTLTLSTCSNVCLLTDYPLHLDFTQPVDAGFRDAFDHAMRSIPGSSGVSSDLTAWLADGNLVITGTTEGKWDNPGIYFDPLEGDILPGEPVIKHDGHQLRVTVPVTDEWGDKPTSLAGKALSFVLTNGSKAQQTVMTVGSTPAASAAPGTGKMMLFALLGGLILNLMPCVLPVMGMKLNSILHAGSNKRTIRLRFLATSAGILTSFMLLAAMVTVLKLTGASLGWGIQFQNPWFIGLMVAVTFLFALNLFGVFEMLLPSATAGRLAATGGAGLGGSFCEGMFATLLATPCSAPFLGTAVAFALGAPLQTLWLIFLMLGVGMSLPWLFVALVPKTAMLLPKPGRWMNTLKVILGLMMLASSLWLATLLNLHLGDTIGQIVMLVLIVVALALFALKGQRSSPLFWLVVISLSVFGGYQLRGLLNASPVLATQSVEQTIPWQPLSEEAIEHALAQGKRVFVDISADWCVTCKVNEHRVLNQPDIIAALSQPDVVALRGDWSQPSALIAAFLEKRNRYAIPFNEVYGPGIPDGEILSPLLDKRTLVTTLNNAKG